MASPKPRPVEDSLSTPFWEGCRLHRLLLQRCSDCGRFRFPAGPLCTACHSPRADWVDSSGRGSVYSWIVVRHPVPAELYADEVPYVVALVELEEGVRMPTNIVGCAPGEVTANMPVELTFRDVDPDLSLPMFRPAGSP